MKFVVWLTVAALTLPAAFSRSRCSDTCVLENERSLRFAILGDIGGKDRFPFTSRIQTKVAKVWGELSKIQKLHFQLELGDNFYGHGVKNVNDSRFQTTFENVYVDPRHTPWYVIAGNHDHFGNVTAQIDYTNRSDRWTFPSLYYKFAYEFNVEQDRTRAEFIMIDTVVLCGNTRDEDEIKATGPTAWIQAIKRGLSPPNPDKYAMVKDPKVEKQWKFIEDQLKSSTADYLFVAGHYPVYSVSAHGSSFCLMRRLRNLLWLYNVTAYLAGHDHSVQGKTGAFVTVELTAENGKINMIDSDGNVIYEATMKKRDKSWPDY